jgi:AcrR family transcriptional regulator
MTLATPKISFSPQNTTRARLLGSAKHLFSVVGYENTTMHAICREAQTPESELCANFGSQQEMLRAIFEEGWNQLIAKLTRLQEVASPRKKLKNLARAVLQLFSQDREFRDLFLLEGRRMDGGEMMILTPSYTDLVALVDSLIAEASPGSEPQQVQMLRSCLMGAVEGVVRDVVSQERCGFPANFTLQQAEQLVPEVVDRLLPATT